jgi:hypothetical protein
MNESGEKDCDENAELAKHRSAGCLADNHKAGQQS